MTPVSSLDSVLDTIQLDVEDPFMLLTQSIMLGGIDDPYPQPGPPPPSTPKPPHPLPQPQML